MQINYQAGRGDLKGKDEAAQSRKEMLGTEGA